MKAERIRIRFGPLLAWLVPIIVSFVLVGALGNAVGGLADDTPGPVKRVIPAVDGSPVSAGQDDIAPQHDSLSVGEASPLVPPPWLFSFGLPLGEGLPPGDGRFLNPLGVAVDSRYNILVADQGNSRIQVFDGNGVFKFKFGSVAEGFTFPKDVEVDSEDRIIVALVSTIQVFDKEGNSLFQFGEDGTGEGQFFAIWGVAVDSSDDIIVLDQHNNRVMTFDSTGQFLSQFGSFCNLSTGEGCIDPDGSGPLAVGDGQFNFPNGVAVDSDDRIIVADRGNDRIQVFDSTGNFLFKFGEFGLLDGHFRLPIDVEVDSADNIVVADFFNNRIQVFDRTGAFLFQFGGLGTGDGQFDRPSGVTVDAADRLLVTDSRNSRVQVFGTAFGVRLDVGSPGVPVTVDAASYLTDEAGILFVVLPPGSYVVSVPPVHEVSAGTRLVFVGWTGDVTSDDPSIPLTVDSAKSLSVTWTTQHFLDVEVSPSGLPEIAGEGWYDEGATAAMGAAPDIVGDGETRFVFDAWTLDGVAQAENPITVLMNAPHEAVAAYTTQHFLTIEKEPPEEVLSISSGWYDEGASASVAAQEILEIIPGQTRVVFTGWTVDGVPQAGASISILMDSPHTVVARYKTQHYLTVTSERGNPQGEGWYDEDATATFSVTSPLGFLIQEVFAGWSGDSASATPTATLLMDSPKTVTAVWRTDYTQVLVVMGGAAAAAVGAFLIWRRRGGRAREGRKGRVG